MHNGVANVLANAATAFVWVSIEVVGVLIASVFVINDDHSVLIGHRRGSLLKTHGRLGGEGAVFTHGRRREAAG